MIQSLPIRGDYVLSFAIQGRPAPKPGEEPSANYRVVSPDYFKTLGIPLLRGRTFTAQDVEKSPMVAIVDEAFAARHFPGEDPIGRGLDIGNGSDGFYEIVGVVGSVNYGGLDARAEPDDVRAVHAGHLQHDVGARAAPTAIRRRSSARRGRRCSTIDRSLPAFSMTPLADGGRRVGGAAPVLDAAAHRVRPGRALPRGRRPLRRRRPTRSACARRRSACAWPSARSAATCCGWCSAAA